MTLENIASITVGQIMPRVTADKENGDKVIETVKVLMPKAISSGVIVKADLGETALGKKIDDDKYTHEGDVVIKLSTPYDAAYVTAEDAGIVVPSFCAAIRITDKKKMDAGYLSAFLNSSYVRDELAAKVVGSARPMIKVTDIRALKIPELEKNDMEDIGRAFILSGRKKATLREMIDNETELMENIVLASIKEGIRSEG
jgi:restriction endonuclease S subunit